MTGDEAQNIVGIILSLKQLYDTFNTQPEKKEKNEVYVHMVNQEIPTSNPTINVTENPKLFSGQTVSPTLSPTIGTYGLFPEAIRSAKTEALASEQ